MCRGIELWRCDTSLVSCVVLHEVGVAPRFCMTQNYNLCMNHIPMEPEIELFEIQNQPTANSPT